MPETPETAPRHPHTRTHGAGLRACRAVTRTWRELKLPLAPGDTAALAPVRRLAAGALNAWHVPEKRADDILLVFSELATNALRHTDGPAQLRLRHTAGRITVEVSDTSPVLPDFTSGPESAAADPYGFGLALIVTALADAVDVIPHPRCGKTITAVFRVGTTGPVH